MSDAIVLGNLVDGVVLVIKAASTARSVSQTAYNRLLSAKADVLGVAFSQVSERKMHYYYEGNYYGYYGQY